MKASSWVRSSSRGTSNELIQKADHAGAALSPELVCMRQSGPRRDRARRDLDEAPHLGHTVRVALSRVRAWPGHTTSVRTGASGPHLDRDDFPPRLSVRKGDTPDRGDR